MSNENIDMLQDMIRDKLADDKVVCDLIEDDEDFEHLMELISNAIVECAGVMLRRSLEERQMYYILGFIIFLLLGILAIVEIQRGLDTYDQD